MVGDIQHKAKITVQNFKPCLYILLIMLLLNGLLLLQLKMMQLFENLIAALFANDILTSVVHVISTE